MLFVASLLFFYSSETEIEKAHNPKTSFKKLILLAQNADVNVQRAVANNPNTTWEALMILSKTNDIQILENVICHPNVTPTILKGLIDTDIELTKLVIKSQCISSELISELILKNEAKELLAHRFNLPPELLHIPINPKEVIRILELKIREYNENYFHRYFLAQYPYTPPEILDILAQDKDSSIRRNVAKNPNTSIKTLTYYSNDEDWTVMSDLAKNSNIPVRILITLSKDKNKYVRSSVAENPNTPIEILSTLAIDKDDYIRTSAARNLNLSDRLLSIFAKDKNYNVRAAVAKHHNIPTKLLYKLAKDKNYSVREAVAENPNAPIQLLEYLLPMKSMYIIAKYPRIPISMLTKWANTKSECSPSVIEWNVAENPNTPVEILRYFTEHSIISMDIHLAKNPNTPIEILHKLSKQIELYNKLEKNASDDYMRRLWHNDANDLKEALALHPFIFAEHRINYLYSDCEITKPVIDLIIYKYILNGFKKTDEEFKLQMKGKYMLLCIYENKKGNVASYGGHFAKGYGEAKEFVILDLQHSLILEEWTEGASMPDSIKVLSDEINVVREFDVEKDSTIDKILSFY